MSVGDVTGEVVMLNVWDALLVNETLEGTAATDGSELLRITVTPLAALTRLAAPVSDSPPVTEAALRSSALRGAVVVTESVTVVPASVAETVAVVLESTPEGLVAGKVAELSPPATVTVAGTLRNSGRSLDRVTTSPAEGAGPFKETVPVETLPPAWNDGLKDRDVRTGGWIVMTDDWLLPESDAKMLTAVVDGAGNVVIGN
jgi:hypothetical protein